LGDFCLLWGERENAHLAAAFYGFCNFSLVAGAEAASFSGFYFIEA
jgi:hypothetical protein